MARWDVQATQERYGQMRKVAADAGTFVISLPRGARRTRRQIVKLKVVMDKIHHRLNADQAWRHVAEGFPGNVREQVGLAVAAAKQEVQGGRA